MSFKVRPARREDAESILTMMRELNDFQELPPAMITLDGIRRDLFDSERPFARVNLAVSPSPDGGEVVVGQVIYFVIFDAVTLRKLAYIEDIYVRPEHRCKGVGVALWKSVAEHGLLRGCDGLRLEVLSTNKEAVDFYAKRGARDLGPVYGFQHFKVVWDASDGVLKA